MANENIDVIMKFGPEAVVAAALRAGMKGVATDTNRFIIKKLSDSSIRYWSDDSLQCLLAGTQTITGNKTSIGTWALNGITTFGAKAKFAAAIVDVPTALSSIIDGVTVLSCASSSHIKVTKNSATPADNTVGMGAGSEDGQVIIISCSDQSGIEIDPAVSGSSDIYFIDGSTSSLYIAPRENAVFLWCSGVSGGNYWKLISTTGTEQIP